MSDKSVFRMFRFLTEKREQKYLKNKRHQIDDSSYFAKVIDRFFETKTKEEIRDFLKSQILIEIDPATVEELPINRLKEKIAYELNEIILRLAN